MKFKFCDNLLLALFLLFLELIKRCSPNDFMEVETVDPLIIKINTNTEKPDNISFISFIILFNDNIPNRTGKSIILKQVNNQSFSKQFISKVEEEQDKNLKRKIEFQINLEEFKGHYGKYNLSYKNETGTYRHNETIFIYANDLVLKNPKKKYFFTGSGIEEINYDLSYEIPLDEINKIKYYKEPDKDNSTELSKDNFTIKDNRLVLNFSKTNEPSSYVFNIYPEYDTDVSNNEIQQFYLYFHDYLLKNDAIYINRADFTNEVSFILSFRYNNINPLSISYLSYLSFSSSYLKKNGNYYDYEITINLGEQDEPGKIYISHNEQKRELFYILYNSNFQRCYDKEKNQPLEITMEWIEEMEYDHMLYFNDTTSKILKSSYSGKSINSNIVYKYTYSTISLNSGIFSLYSLIPPLSYSYDYNPVDNKHLFFYINPNSETFDKQYVILYSHNNSKQYLNITSSDDSNGIAVLKEIILKKDGNGEEILLPQTDNICINDRNGTLSCDLKDIIINYGDEKNGDYSIIYKSKCDKNLTINGKRVTIRRGIGLSDVSPKWINRSSVKNSTIILTYDGDLTDRNLKICFKLKDDSNCTSPESFTTNKEKLIAILKDMDDGRYYVNTIIEEDNIDFTPDEPTFKVSDPKITFNFSHHYFVKNDNDENKLYVNVSGNDDNEFGCIIVENIDNETLNNLSNCNYFEYPIKKLGTIRFSYYDIDGFKIPINDSIVVVSHYSNYFLFDEKICYYYQFDITIDISNLYENLNITVFLKYKNEDERPFILLDKDESINNKYTLKDINSSFINVEFELYISESYEDDKVYLYKSDNGIKFTAIKTPEYIIEPNRTIVFNEIYCNLNLSTFIIKKADTTSIQNYLNYWKFDDTNHQLYYNISGDFYKANRFKNYFYQIDFKNITDIDDGTLNLTFVSKRLNETIFDIKKVESDNYVNITNREKDFYFPLISELNTYQKSKYANNNITNSIDNLITDKNEYTIKFIYNIGINDVLILNYLKRRTETWEEEENLGNSIYYFFNKDNVINGSSIDISPKLFAFNILKEEYLVTIKCNEEKKDDYNISNLIDCSNQTITNHESEEVCSINISTLRENQPGSITLNIDDGISNFNERIDFVYYHLDEDSKKCQTQNSNMNNITLLVEIPNENLKDKIKLTSPDTDIIGNKTENNQISFILNGSNINLQTTFLNLYTEDGDLDHLFVLQDLGTNLLPKYKIRFNNNQNFIYLLPEDNQIVKVIISVENNEIINLTDISGFKIKENNKTVEKRSIIGEPSALNLIFNLSSEDKSANNYSLIYIDRCGKEFETDLKINILVFNLRRKYFVLNNNKNLKVQTLIIDGGLVNNKISISVYKNGEYWGEADNTLNYYYLNFSQSSEGNYTFIVNNDNIKSKIKETVYVRQNLTNILNLKNNISNCMFSNENNSIIKDFSYTIIPSNLNTNFEDFQSFITDNEEDFINLTSPINIKDKTKTFSINYSEEVKNKINLNNQLYLYLTENDDKAQPIYIFNFRYTNIELHPDFNKLIYTDADYILFKMKCRINNMKNFVLFKNNINDQYNISCEDRGTNDIYNEERNEFKCYLSSNDNKKNKLIDFGGTVFQYGNFSIKYDQIQITNQPFFLSQDIYKADFTINRPYQIDKNKNITIDVKTSKTTFYFSEIEKVTYKYKSKVSNGEENIVPNYNSDNYISFKLFIRNGTNYTIYKICRKKCNYCKYNESNDCHILKEDYFLSNTPDVEFNFDRHYIALSNSTYRNGLNDGISNLKITLIGENYKSIKQIYYTRYRDSKNIDRSDSIKNINESININLSVGKYTFSYQYNNTNYTIEDIVLVTNYDYEMFDFTDFSNNCIFYELASQSKILVSISVNPNYEFKNDVKYEYLILEIKGESFPYNVIGYTFTNNNLLNNGEKNKIFFKESNDINKDFVFTTFQNINTVTFNDLSTFYYKDNIVFNNVTCKLNNIYIKSSKNPNEDPSLLQCNNLTEKLYCDAINYKFSYKTNDTFYLLIGKNQLLSSKISLNIYNSINESFFTLSYIKPTIYIESSNFDMEKIFHFKIDNETITNTSFNKTPNSNSIYYQAKELDNRTDHYVTELRRKDHNLDREEIIKIKKVYLKIEKRICPNFKVEVFGESGSWCITCLERFGENGIYKWYQNGECVSGCTGDYAIYDQVNYFCMNCSEKSYVNGQTICGCVEGTVKSPLDGVCYLPDDPEIKKALLLRPNAQCQRIDGITYNYCKNDTTFKCEHISFSGYDFPICHCKDGYTGKYCEKNNSEINLNNNIEDILNMTKNDRIDENDSVVISKIRGIVYFIEKDNSYSQNINNDKINSLLEVSINCIRTAINERHKSYQIYDVIEITVYLLVNKINNAKRLRLLEEEKENRNKLDFILENAHYLNYLANKDYSGSEMNIQTDGLNLISFISYREAAIDSSFKTYIKNMTYNSSIIGYTNLNENNVGENKENMMAVLTIFNRKLFNFNSPDDGLIFNFSVSNKEVHLENLKDFYAYIYSPNINVNFELANYYQSRNINIYDKYDHCFTDNCFTSEEFDYDLTQKYRKKYVFQKWSLKSDICRYHSFESASNNIEILCQKFENFGKINDSIDSPEYATLNLIPQKDYVDNQDKVYNLPMKCKKKMSSRNYAFWIFFIICILEIAYIIGITILTCGSLRRVSIRKGLINDGFFYKIQNNNNEIKNSDDDSDSKNHSLKTKEKNNNSTTEIQEKPPGEYNKTLPVGILSNFKELHPLSSLFRVSIISPLIMNSWFFVFNTICLLGFNALIYYEGLIEKRIYDKKRHYFDYPMRKEFHKIILSILLQIAFTVIIKIVILVSLQEHDDFESKLRNCKLEGEIISNDIALRYDNFQKDMFIRRLIGGILMLIIIIFFFYYSVVFCEVYLNTQRNLVFSWIWSLFWEWVIFAPIYIVIISVLENKKSDSKDPLIYYLKRLFFF